MVVLSASVAGLCISQLQFQLRPASTPPPPGNGGAFARLVSPGGGALIHKWLAIKHGKFQR